MTFTVPIFTKLAAIQHFYVDVSCTELYPNWTKNVEDAGKILCNLLNKIPIECHPYLSVIVDSMGRNSPTPLPPIEFKLFVYRFSRYACSISRYNVWYRIPMPVPNAAEIPQAVLAQVLDHRRGGTVVKVLCYKSECRWFDPGWCHLIFH